MRTLFFIFGMLFSVSAFTQETAKTGLHYCVQVVSTENPEQLQPLMFMMREENANIEKAEVKGRIYYRVIFIYKSVKEQDEALIFWKKTWSDAIRLTRTKEQVQKMYPLFTYD